MNYSKCFTEGNKVVTETGPFCAATLATCRNAEDAEFVAGCFRAFSKASHYTRMALLDGGIIDRAAVRYEREAEILADRIMSEAVSEGVNNAPA